MLSLLNVVSLAVLAGLSAAQSPVWGQCGGQGWTGATTCVSGSVCTFSNTFYSQCIPSSSAPTTVSSVPNSPSTTSSAPASTGNCAAPRTKFKFFGVNQSGAEFGNTAIPGQYQKDYIFPAPSSIDYFVGQGFNFFRVPFLMERLAPPSTGMTGAFNQTYLSLLQSTVSYITGKGAFVALDPHNFMRYNNAVISDTTAFAKFWTNVATLFKSNKNVIFDIMNEPNGIDAQTVFNLNQAAVNAIRAAGATSQLILVEGTSWTGAWTWTTSGNSQAFGAIKDPNNNVAIQMHQYLDSDGSGTSATCVSSTIGAERLANATAWLKQTGLKGFLGEIGAGSNQPCITAVFGAMCAMQQSGVWIGASWWAAGPWWADYFQSIEPPTGAAISQVLPQALKPFL